MKFNQLYLCSERLCIMRKHSIDKDKTGQIIRNHLINSCSVKFICGSVLSWNNKPVLFTRNVSSDLCHLRCRFVGCLLHDVLLFGCLCVTGELLNSWRRTWLWHRLHRSVVIDSLVALVSVSTEPRLLPRLFKYLHNNIT